jgi:hypothetical protein
MKNNIFDIYAILDKQIKKEMENKNNYIKLNGYAHKDILNRFDERICTLTGLYFIFNEEMKK